ncbi:hypothetical protein [Limimaricola cinnabarinus]|uniref:Uncharacterized protein n=1 Tax=Limimaricola cinnabarinus TaxID=1125964 RepID=A0A2G1MFS9_9RHOB|nr:hypothetical protein [Limimaricola cinnabarinus]PHP27520.1 hypothetical protein CJ301_10185 [Limimaricola cinnabarinus]
MTPTYQAGPIKRHRATQAEMEERASFLLRFARLNAPVTVRQLFYAATVAGLIEKSESGYAKVQAQVLKLRRDGRMPYACIADATRYMRKAQSYDGWEQALQDTALVYRKNLWAETALEVEIWLEKSALAGVLMPVTREYDVPLMPTGGYTSETFAHSAVANLAGAGKTLVVYSLYDFDRSGQDAAASLQEKVERFGREYGVPVIFERLGLSERQVIDMDLPTRPAKRGTTADRRWPHAFAAELDAIPPELLRDIVREAIERHLPYDQLAHLKQVEAVERETLMQFIGRAA